MVSVDGFFAGPNGELDWHVVDGEFHEYAIDMLNAADTILFGRVTYRMMADYWPTPTAIARDPVIAERMNNLAKIVFSTTQDRLEWNNSRLATGTISEEVTELKREHGKDILVLGSGAIVSALSRLGLIDEYRLIVNPVVLGGGKMLFKDVRDRIKLKHLKTRTLSSGNVLLYYRPEGAISSAQE